MQKKIRFATVFLNIENIHLIKDPGMIPYTMQKYYGYESTVVLSSANEYFFKDILFIDIDTPMIHESMHSPLIIKKIKRSVWILKNAPYINVLNLFFFNKWTWINIYIYKKRNRHGLVYVHLDTSGRFLLKSIYPKSLLWKKWMKLFLSPDNLKDVIWGIQNEKAAEILREKWPFESMKYIPDGYFFMRNETVDFGQKMNVLLTVTRAGAAEKRVDVLIDAFRLASPQLRNWELRIVGPVEEEFRLFVKNYFEMYPEIEKKIKFTGPVVGRDELQNEYIKAKIFCLTSDYESFGIVQAEALSQGCSIICSDIPASLVKQGEFGEEFTCGNAKMLCEKMILLANDNDRLKGICERGQAFAKEHYSWEKILKDIDEWIKEKNFEYES